MDTQISPRACNAIDREIAVRLRIRRLELGLSQGYVAGEIGVTFQQLQKYEQAINRISASTLFRLTQVLKLSVSELFPTPQTPRAVPAFDDKAMRKTLDLFARLRTPEARTQALHFLAELAATSGDQALKSSPDGNSRPSKASGRSSEQA